MAIDALRRWMLRRRRRLPLRPRAPRSGAATDGFDPDAPFFQALADDPAARADASFIAEPWDIGPGGYRLGNSPRVGRMERPLPRRRAPLLARRRAACAASSRPASPARATCSRTRPRRPKGVNFIVAHDGFTLADLVSYDHKHNEANGEHNRDGTDDNYSWNNGVEGPSDDPAIVAARARDERNLLTLLFASRGTPMLAMGAELGLSQGGNNNAYAQDNATTWIDWARPTPR